MTNNDQKNAELTIEQVQELQDTLTQAKTNYGPASEQHRTAIARAESRAIELVAGYLSLHDQLQQERVAHVAELEQYKEAIRLASDWAVLGKAVHASWRDGMLKQGRTVEKERMEWETLPARDKLLDQYIAGRVIAAARAALAPEPQP